MATVTTLNASDLITDSRAVINTNFANVNAGLPAYMTVAQFDTETTSGTVRGSTGYSHVILTDSVYTVVWNGSAWAYYYGNLLVSPPVLQSISYLNESSGSVTATHSTSTKALLLEAPAVSGEHWRLASFGALPGGTSYSLTVGLLPFSVQGNIPTVGMWVGDSGTTPKLQFHGVYNGSSEAGFAGYQLTNPTTYSGGSAYQRYPVLFGAAVFLRITRNGGNFEFYVSSSGRSAEWVLVHSGSITAFLASPAQWGVSVNSANVYVPQQGLFIHAQAA